MKNSLFKYRIIPLMMAMLTSGYAFADLTPACSPSYNFTDAAHYIQNVTIAGTTLNHNPTYNVHNYTSVTFTLNAGDSYTGTATTIGWESAGAACDFNNDGDFDDPGEILALPMYGDYPQTNICAYSIAGQIPPTVVTGDYRFRVWCRQANGGDGNPLASPCGAYNYGSWVDYTLHVVNTAECQAPTGLTVSNIQPASADFSWTASISTPAGYMWKVVNQGDNPNVVAGVASGTVTGTSASASSLTPATNYQLYVQSDCGGSDISLWSSAANFQTPCDGMPAAGTVNSTQASVCPNTSFTLSLTGASAAATGISFHWQSSATGTAPWTDITGTTASINISSQSQATYYRAYVACSGSGLADTSDAFLVAQNPGSECYCIPPPTTSTSGDIITNVNFAGINNTSGTTGAPNGYANYTETVTAAEVLPTSTYPISVSVSNGGTEFVSVWIDYNHDGSFDVSEYKFLGSGNNTTISSSITIPADAIPGYTRMRVRVKYASEVGSGNSCTSPFTYGETEDYSVYIIALDTCDDTPVPGNTLATTTSFCVTGSTTLTLENNYLSYSGIQRQWQKSTDEGVTWLDISSATAYNYTTPAITTTTQYRCRVICTTGADTAYSTPITLSVHPLPVVTVSPTTATFCSSAPVALTASGADTYTWSPSTGLDATTGVIVNASPAALTTYTVTGTDINGCVSTAVANIGPITDIQLTGSIIYSGACEAGNPITVSTDPVTTPSGSMEYQFTDDLDNVLQAWSASTDFTTTPSTDGTYTYKIYGRNTDCPGDVTSTPAEVVAVIGFTGNITVTDATCSGDDDGSITVSEVTGPGLGGTGLTWYSNDFSSATLNPSQAALYGVASIGSGQLTLNVNVGGLRGAFGIFNPEAVDPLSIHVSFDLTVSSAFGADGMSWNYGNDAVFNAANGNPEVGATSKLAIGFDSYTNEGNTRGIYLIYNGGWIGTATNPTPTTSGVLAYSNNMSWAGTTKNIVIDITEDGLLTLTVGGVVIFNNIQLPPDYVNANKSNWKQLFDARTGGVSELHAIDNVNITYSSLVYNYGISEGGSGSLPSAWQTSGTFNNLAPDNSYDVWVANPADPTVCNKFLGTYTIDAPLHIMPSAAYTSGQQTCNVDDATLTVQVNTAGIYDVQYSVDGGVSETQSGIASINDGSGEFIVVGNLAPGAYTNIKVIDPVTPCNSNTLSGPIVLDSLVAGIASSTSSENLNQAANATLTYSNDDCEKIATVTSTAELGAVTANVTLNPVLFNIEGAPYVGRYYEITPTTNTNQPATITLYFNQSDLEAYNTAINDMVSDTAYEAIDPSAANLLITAFHGLSSSGTTGPDGQFDTTGHDVITPGSITNTSGYWEVTFTSPNGFSGFFAHTAISTITPITLGDISAHNKGAVNMVNWNTRNEEDGDHFEIERSQDGKHFNVIGSMSVNGIPSDYTFEDAAPFSGENYYRLQLVNTNGRKLQSKVVSAFVKDGSFRINIYPNPVRDLLTVKVSGGIMDGNGVITLMDATGRKIKDIPVESAVTNIDMNGLAQGMYLLKYQDTAFTEIIKVNKQ